MFSANLLAQRKHHLYIFDVIPSSSLVASAALLTLFFDNFNYHKVTFLYFSNTNNCKAYHILFFR